MFGIGKGKTGPADDEEVIPAPPVRVAVLDENNVFQGMQERPADAALTSRELAGVAIEDGKAGKVRWETDAALPQGGEFVSLTCAVLDDRGVYMGMMATPSRGDRTDRHLVLINECDLPAGKYRWEPAQVDENHPFGGRFVPLPREQQALAGEPTVEQALAFQMLHLSGKAGFVLPDVSLKWLDGVILSVDFTPFRKAPLIVAYAAARGIDLGAGK